MQKKNGFSVVREFCGHGIGRNFHEEPQVLHYGSPGQGMELVPGMIFTIEPMINAGKAPISELADGWTIVTRDRSLSAQWEHTILVSDDGAEVLTLSAGAQPATGIHAAKTMIRPKRHAGDLQQLIAEFRSRIQQGQNALRSAYQKTANAGNLLRGRTRLIDRILCDLWQQLDLPSGLALVAVGGYGRGELYPASDIDLLLLVPEGFDPVIEPRLEQIIGLFWDIGLDVGHSVRSPSECVEEAARDITVQTSLLEARLLTGSRTLFAELGSRLGTAIQTLSFLKAKQLEQAERYARHNDTPYSLEPNCKESPGGLRDLQIIMWVARATGIGQNWSDLATHGLVTDEEAQQLARAERFLRQLRIRLHYIAGRREERLLFDYQESLAAAFELEQTATKRASELLMQRYYLNAKLVIQLNTIMLQNLEARLFPQQQSDITLLDDCFQTTGDLLDIRNDQVFASNPPAILQAFLTMQQHPELKGMTARTLRKLWQARTGINAEFRRNPENRALFIRIFQQEHLIHELRRMNQYGILGHYLPAFGRIVGQMQHDLFHVYTVDQHIMQVIRNLRRFTMPEFAHEYPFCTRLMTAMPDHWLLYIAALFHDIAKGRGGNHSELGMADARRFCRAHGFNRADAELVVFLVQNHLTMSAVAQKQDLSDPEVIAAFSSIARNERHLTALYLLTVADIRGTSPKVWNAWKGKLLEDLYRVTLQRMRGQTPQPMAGVTEKQEEACALLRYHGLAVDVEKPFWQHLDTAYFMRHDAEEIAWHTRKLYYRPASTDPVVQTRTNPIGEGPAGDGLHPGPTRSVCPHLRLFLQAGLLDLRCQDPHDPPWLCARQLCPVRSPGTPAVSRHGRADRA
jgi:[protein-PII] uridylyltransferase